MDRPGNRVSHEGHEGQICEDVAGGTWRRRKHKNHFSLCVHLYPEVSQATGMRRREWEAQVTCLNSTVKNF